MAKEIREILEYQTQQALPDFIRQRRAQTIVPTTGRPMSQKKLDRATDASLTYISKIEQGRDYPSQRMLQQIGSALGLAETEITEFVNRYAKQNPNVHIHATFSPDVLD